MHWFPEIQFKFTSHIYKSSHKYSHCCLWTLWMNILPPSSLELRRQGDMFLQNSIYKTTQCQPRGPQPTYSPLSEPQISNNNIVIYAIECNIFSTPFRRNQDYLSYNFKAKSTDASEATYHTRVWFSWTSTRCVQSSWGWSSVIWDWLRMNRCWS